MKKIVILILIGFLSIQSCLDSLSVNSKVEREKFSKVKVGMLEIEVVKILGKPDYTQIDSLSNNSIYYFYYSKNMSVTKSEIPFVLFDSSKKVRLAIYGD